MLTIRCNSSVRCGMERIISEELSKKTTDDNLVFIVPETAKASVERMLFEQKGNNHAFNGKCENVYGKIINGAVTDEEVLSFLRLSNVIRSLCGANKYRDVQDEVLRTVIYKILTEHQDEFIDIKRFTGRVEYIDLLIKLLGDFGRYDINADKLSEALSSDDVENKDDDAYYSKLQDVTLLMRYIEKASEDYSMTLLISDIKIASDLLEELRKKPEMAADKRFRALSSYIKSKFVIVGFGAVRALTPQEVRLISLMSALGANVSIYPLCAEGDSPIYSFGHDTVALLKKNVPDCKVETFEECDSESENNLVRFAGDYAIGNIGEYLGEDESFVPSEFSDVDNMLSYLAHEIIWLTRVKNYRYRDIRIFTADDSYVDRLRGIMKLFSLDMFIDKKIALNNTPAMKFTELFLQLPLYDFYIDDVLRILRIGILPVRRDVVDYFENYCIRENIRYGVRIFNRDYFVQTEGRKRPKFPICIDDHIIEDGGEYLWNAVVQRVLIDLRDSAMENFSLKTIKDKSAALARVINDKKMYIESLRNEFLDKGDSDNASAIVRGYKEVMSLLFSMSQELYDVEITAEQFSSMVKLDMKNKAVGTIPLTADAVEITSIGSSYNTPCKVMFILGAASDNFPHQKSVEGLMTDDELVHLGQTININLPDRGVARSKEEFVESALLLNSISDKLYFLNYMPTSPSQVYVGMCSAFKDVVINRNCYNTPVCGNPIKRRHDFEKALVSPSDVETIFDNTGYVSVSSLERYNSCPMKYMLNDVLKIRAREDLTTVKMNDIGTIVHSMLEHCINDVKESCQGQVDKIIVPEGEELSSATMHYFKVSTEESTLPDARTQEFSINPGIKIRRIFEKALPEILKEFKNTGYVPEATEKRIGSGSTTDFSIMTQSGTVFKFKGTIDRVDKKQDGEEIRIIDYKTGEKSISYEELANGVQLQLFAYADVIEKQENVVVNDVAYLELLLKHSKSNSGSANLNYKKSGLDAKQFHAVEKYNMRLIKDSCNNILQGRAEAVVNYCSDRSCENCDYLGACGNDVLNLKKKANVVEQFVKEHKDNQNEEGKKKKKMELLMDYIEENVEENEVNGNI